MSGRGSVFKRCSKCGARVTERRCSRCAGERFSWATVVYINGKQRWKSGFPTKTAAQAHVTDVLGRVQSRTYRAPDKMTLATYLKDEWLPMVRAEIEPTSFATVAGHVGNYIAPAEIGQTQLDQLTPESIEAFYGRLLTEPRAGGSVPLSTTTVQRVHATLHAALERLVPARLPNNPARKTKPRARKSEGLRTEMRVWTIDELQAFMASVTNDRLLPLWQVLAFTGMRRGEAAALSWRDLDLEDGTAIVRRSIGVASYQLHESTPKSGKSRTIDLDSETVSILRAFLERQRFERRGLGLVEPTSADRIFAREDGVPIHPERMSKAFNAAVKASGLPRIRLHDLRHTHASHLIAAGVNVKVIQIRLGHSSIQITLDVYGHLLPESQREAVDKLAAVYMASAQ